MITSRGTVIWMDDRGLWESNLDGSGMHRISENTPEWRYPYRRIPNPLHPLLPPLATDGQVEEKPASGPRPIETVREWEHDPLSKHPGSTDPVFKPPGEIPDPCDYCGCGSDTWRSKGIVERDVETGDIYRRNGKAVPRERA